MKFSVLSRGISIERLQTFCRVVETGSIVAAAEGDPNRQSLYSRQIRQLEEAMEKPLFIREGRSMRLNEDGRRLAVMTNAYFSALQEFAYGEESSHIRIGAGESAFEAFVYPTFQALRDIFSLERLTLVSLSTRDVVKSLNSGSIDLGIVRENAELDGCDTRPIGVLNFVLVVPRILLPEGNRVGLTDIQETLPMAMLSGEGTFVKKMTTLIHEHRWPLVPSVTADSFTKLATLAKVGNLAVVLPSQLSGSFPVDKYVRYELPELGSLSRGMVLAVSSHAKSIRPSLGKWYEKVASVLLMR